MRLSFDYDKKKVIQALRYHFIWQPEIKILLVSIIAFDLVAGILYFMDKIRPQPFILGSFIWFISLIAIWYLLPYSIYKRSATFKEKFVITFNENSILLQNPNGYVEWKWGQFTRFIESPNFFHLYFSPKSFFLVPKDEMNEEFRYDLRLLLKKRIKG